MDASRSKTSYEDALALIVRDAFALRSEVVPIESCHGRVLAEEVVAGVNVPPYARSAVDGFAVSASDLLSASEGAPVLLTVTGSSRPGSSPAPALRLGTSVRVATGAPVPDGADAVVMREVVEEHDGIARFTRAVPSRKHVITPGEDVSAGEVLLRRGRRLRPQDLGMVASLEIGALLVVRSPRVEILVTGDEIVAPGVSRTGTKIVDSNSIVVRLLAARDGAIVLPVRYVPDEPSAIEQAFRQSDADVILVSGGTSAGDEDHAPRVLASVGTLSVHGVDARPGGPTSFGRLGERWVVLLPGHPVACLAGYELFAGPLLRKLEGRGHEWPHAVVEAPLADALESVAGRTDYVRVVIDDGVVRPLSHHTGASNLSSAVRADGAILVPSDAARLERGSIVRVHLY
ncbi:MAG: molybdopterin molybdotransferase MoeA [Polyangiaceae bacterium]|nr:molybdopterin molybdotransferase MoeA [Polyangiaceae bacterium]